MFIDIADKKILVAGGGTICPAAYQDAASNSGRTSM